MRKELQENRGIPAQLLWTLAIIAGISVANLYYVQPLLNMIRSEMCISEFQANMIAMITQIGYALGLLFIIPLGDMIQRRKIIITNFCVLIISLLTIACADNIYTIWGASLFTGMCSVTPQIFIPIASQFSQPEHKTRNVGVVLSGLLTGILASRVISGWVGEWMGWREMYYIASALMMVCGLVTMYILPNMRPNFLGTYAQLMQTLGSLFKSNRAIRIYPIRAALAFGSFLAMWSCLAFKMAQAPFFAGSNIVGMLGLCGIAGALTASTIGKYIHIFGIYKFNIVGCILMILAWILLYFGENYYISIIAGIILIDIGMQCIQLSNQSKLFELYPQASNRVNTIFMTIYFIGGATGTFLSGMAWSVCQWHGVSIIGLTLIIVSLCITLYTQNKC